MEQPDAALSVGQRCAHISFSMCPGYLKGLGDMHAPDTKSVHHFVSFHFRAHFLIADRYLMLCRRL